MVGGEGNTEVPSGVFDALESYDPATDTWSVHEPMINPRHGMGAASMEISSLCLEAQPFKPLAPRNTQMHFSSERRKDREFGTQRFVPQKLEQLLFNRLQHEGFALN